MIPYVCMLTLSLVNLRHDVTILGGEVRGRDMRQGSVDLEEGGPVCLAYWLGVIQSIRAARLLEMLFL